mgnify:CR=1 FL=1
MKKKILITIDSLTSGGAEKSLISLLTLNYLVNNSLTLAALPTLSLK